MGFEAGPAAGPAAGWRGRRRERAGPSASCLPCLPEVDFLSILVTILLLLLALTLGSLAGFCVWRRRRKQPRESRAPRVLLPDWAACAWASSTCFSSGALGSVGTRDSGGCWASPLVLPSGAVPACLQPSPMCRFTCRGLVGDSSGVAVSGWSLPLRTWERARTRLLSRIFSRSGPAGVKAGLPEADAWLGRTPSGGLCSSFLCFSPHRAQTKGISDNL